jgi:hypothetical protein
VPFHSNKYETNNLFMFELIDDKLAELREIVSDNKYLVYYESDGSHEYDYVMMMICN